MASEIVTDAAVSMVVRDLAARWGIAPPIGPLRRLIEQHVAPLVRRAALEEAAAKLDDRAQNAEWRDDFFLASILRKEAAAIRALATQEPGR